MSNEDTVKEKKETEEEYSEDCDGIGTRSCSLLQLEYERCQQQVYDLRRKLGLNESMLREVQEANESLERSLERQISEKRQAVLQEEERHRDLAHRYQEVISNLERKVAEQEKEMEELRERVADRSAETEWLVRAETRSREAAETGETDNASLKNRNEQLLSSLREATKKYQSAEQTIEQLQNRCDHFERYSRDVKQQLDEKSEALEEARAEVALRRAEAAAASSSSLEPDPSRESRKGNSLFAEVEDRRRTAISKMNDLREKYTELKRICKSQISQIKTLRAERVTSLRKWQSDTDCAFAENEQLLQKYRNRISDLESKLKSEMKKTDDSKRTVADYGDASFGYLQSLLDAKKKQTDQLAIRVEDLCTKLLIQEETTMDVSKQLHYWRRKASSLEVRVSIFAFAFALAFVFHFTRIFLFHLTATSNAWTGRDVRDTSRIEVGGSCRGRGTRNLASRQPADCRGPPYVAIEKYTGNERPRTRAGSRHQRQREQNFRRRKAGAVRGEYEEGEGEGEGEGGGGGEGDGKGKEREASEGER